MWPSRDGPLPWVALLAAILALGAGSRLLGRGESQVVTRGDLVQTVDVEGELRAVRAVDIGPPPVTEIEFKIASMASEGSVVQKGEPILGFDTQALQKMLDDKRAERAEARQKLGGKEVDLEVKRLALDDQISKAEAALRKARLKADVPPELVAHIEAQKAQLDETGSERDVENLKAERAVLVSTSEAEIRSLRSESERAEGRVAALEGAIARMNVTAPQAGIVIYRTSWRDEKKKVGDNVWLMETVMSLADLGEMYALGDVDEADGGQIAVGQKVTLRLEARPDVDIHGRIRTIGRTVRRKSWRLPNKVYKVEIALDTTDPTLMRPAMRFRGEVETARAPRVLLVSRRAVFLRPSGPVVRVQRAFAVEEAPLQLGRGNRTLLEVRGGLREGDRVLPQEGDIGGATAP